MHQLAAEFGGAPSLSFLARRSPRALVACTPPSEAPPPPPPPARPADEHLTRSLPLSRVSGGPCRDRLPRAGLHLLLPAAGPLRLRVRVGGLPERALPAGQGPRPALQCGLRADHGDLRRDEPPRARRRAAFPRRLRPRALVPARRTRGGGMIWVPLFGRKSCLFAGQAVLQSGAGGRRQRRQRASAMLISLDPGEPNAVEF